MEDIINLVNGYKLALIKVHVTSSMPIVERLSHTNNDISMFMAIIIELSSFKLEFFYSSTFSIIVKIIKVMVKLSLKEDILDNYDSLRFEYFIGKNLSTAMIS